MWRSTLRDKWFLASNDLLCASRSSRYLIHVYLFVDFLFFAYFPLKYVFGSDASALGRGNGAGELFDSFVVVFNLVEEFRQKASIDTLRPYNLTVSILLISAFWTLAFLIACRKTNIFKVGQRLRIANLLFG